MPRVWCLACGLVRQVKIRFADARKRFTRALERYVLELCRFATIKIEQAEASKIPLLMSFARTLGVRRNGMLVWYDYPISTGPLEGTNNKIKTLSLITWSFVKPGFCIEICA